MGLIWNPAKGTDEENTKWAWLRANEWGALPLFAMQPIAPVLMIFFVWWEVIVAIWVANLLWSFVRYKFVSPIVSDLIGLIVHLKWFVSLPIGFYFILQHNYLYAGVAGLYPLVTLILLMISPPSKIGVIQDTILQSMGYTRKAEN